MVITGAGCSAASGIPAYRNDTGRWLRAKPIVHHDFISFESTRQRYWVRSFNGWPLVCNAEPNQAHHCLARFEQKGYCSLLVTQNVDRLHQKAGHRNVIDLHGRLDQVRCLDCHHHLSRAMVQEELMRLKPGLTSTAAEPNPDGDAEISHQPINTPSCDMCGGILIPNVVFYGGTVDKTLVKFIYERLILAPALLVVGSSLSVFSAYRFCRRAHELGIPVIAINKGQTRADKFLALKLNEECIEPLNEILEFL